MFGVPRLDQKKSDLRIEDWENTNKIVPLQVPLTHNDPHNYDERPPGPRLFKGLAGSVPTGSAGSASGLPKTQLHVEKSLRLQNGAEQSIMNYHDMMIICVCVYKYIYI